MPALHAQGFSPQEPYPSVISMNEFFSGPYPAYKLKAALSIATYTDVAGTDKFDINATLTAFSGKKFDAFLFVPKLAGSQNGGQLLEWIVAYDAIALANDAAFDAELLVKSQMQKGLARCSLLSDSSQVVMDQPFGIRPPGLFRYLSVRRSAASGDVTRALTGDVWVRLAEPA